MQCQHKTAFVFRSCQERMKRKGVLKFWKSPDEFAKIPEAEKVTIFARIWKKYFEVQSGTSILRTCFIWNICLITRKLNARKNWIRSIVNEAEEEQGWKLRKVICTFYIVLLAIYLSPIALILLFMKYHEYSPELK